MKRTNNNFVAVAEYQVLKLMIQNKELDIKALSSSNFPHKKSKILFKVIEFLHNRGEAINESSLYRECNNIDPEFDLGVVRAVLSMDVDNSNFDQAYEVLKKQAIRGKVAQALDRVLEHLNSTDDLNQEAVISALYTAQDTLQSGSKNIKSKTLMECLDEYELTLLQRQLGHYFPFYDTFLDTNLIKKASPGQVILMAGSTGTGKSAYALNVINGLINNDRPVMYFSLEMDTESTMDRLMAMRLGLEVADFYKTGSDMDSVLALVREEKERLRGKPFRLIDDPSMSLADIVRQIREFKMTYKTQYVTVFLDLVTQVKDFIAIGTRGNLSTAMELAVNKLNGISKKENVCFCCVAQMNRDADSAHITELTELNALRPNLNNVKNSNALGERSRCVLSLFRPKYYAERLFPDNEEVEFMPDHLEVQILKQSMGKVGLVGKYLFNGPMFKITPVEGVEMEEVQ